MIDHERSRRKEIARKPLPAVPGNGSQAVQIEFPEGWSPRNSKYSRVHQRTSAFNPCLVHALRCSNTNLL